MDSATWREARPIVVAGIVLLAVIFLCLLIIQLRTVIAILFLGIVLGLALNPIVDACSKVAIPRVLAVLLVYAVLASLFAGFSYYAYLEVSSVSFEQELRELRQEYDRLQAGTFLPQRQQLEDGLAGLSRQATSGLLHQAVGVVGAVVALLTMLVMALLFTLTQDRMREQTLNFVPPVKRPGVEALMDRLAVGLRGFIRAEIIAMFVVGTVTYIGLTIIGVRLPFVLAVIAGLFEVLPFIGPWLAFLPALAIASLDGIWTMVAVSLLYLGIQQFESYVLTPLVHGRETRLPGLLILTALLFGASLMGLLGALIALPIAVILHILYFEVVVPWNERRISNDTLTQAADGAGEMVEPAIGTGD